MMYCYIYLVEQHLRQPNPQLVGYYNGSDLDDYLSKLDYKFEVEILDNSSLITEEAAIVLRKD